eukprot:60586_1
MTSIATDQMDIDAELGIRGKRKAVEMQSDQGIGVYEPQCKRSRKNNNEPTEQPQEEKATGKSTTTLDTTEVNCTASDTEDLMNIISSTPPVSIGTITAAKGDNKPLVVSGANPDSVLDNDDSNNETPKPIVSQNGTNSVTTDDKKPTISQEINTLEESGTNPVKRDSNSNSTESKEEPNNNLNKITEGSDKQINNISTEEKEEQRSDEQEQGTAINTSNNKNEKKKNNFVDLTEFTENEDNNGDSNINKQNPTISVVPQPPQQIDNNSNKDEHSTSIPPPPPPPHFTPENKDGKNSKKK